MIHYSNPPILLHDVIEDLDDVLRLLEGNAPYTPLGGWYNPGADLDAATRPLWFQNDFVHADYAAEGSDLFRWHQRVIETAKEFYGAEVIVPHSVYVNFMAAIEHAGPAHTDNPRFRGRERSNTPMWLLRAMLWSGLFDRWTIVQATSIWWLNDVEGGGLYYWPDGPDKPPHQHINGMANTSLVGDNHGMFHQVGPVGPYDQGTLYVTPRAELAPVADGSRDWAVTDRGEVRYRAPLDEFRVSVLWKADVYRTEEERQRVASDTLSMDDVARIFDEDLEKKRAGFGFDLARLEDPEFASAVREVYPDAVPVGALPCVFDNYN